jgi:hypothetical protein
MADIAFGVLILISPAQMTGPPWSERLTKWHLAVRHGRAQGCLFCPRAWRAESEPPPAAFVTLRDEPMAALSPICAACAGRFPDRDTLMDQAVVLAKYRFWPNVAAHRVSVG